MSIGKEYIKPTLVLTVICLVITALLALTNEITQPIIEANNLRIAEASRAEVLAEADGFHALEGNFPENTVDVYEADNGAGYAITVTSKGYDSTPLKVMIGIQADGTIEKVKVLSSNETPGLGSKVTEDSFTGQFTGMTSDGVDGMQMISGATYSSKAMRTAVEQAFVIYDMVKGA